MTPPVSARARAVRRARRWRRTSGRERHRELPQYDERFRAVEKTPGRLAKFSSLPTGRDAAGDESTSSSEGTGSEYGLDDDADAWWNAPFGTLTFAEGLKRTPRKVKKRTTVRAAGDEKENAGGTKRRTKTAAFASPANKPGPSKPHEPTKGATRGDKARQPPRPGSMLDPVALARALDVTRAKPSGARGVTRWAPPAVSLPSPAGSVASIESTESDDWHGRNIRRDLRRRASAERAAIAKTTAADTDMNAVRPRNVTGVTKWGKPPPAPDERRATSKEKVKSRRVSRRASRTKTRRGTTSWDA